MDVTSALLNQSEETLHIALCVNDGWADYVGPLMYSLSQHHPAENLKIHLVYRDITAEKLTILLDFSKTLSNIDLICYPIEQGIIDKIPVEGYYLPLETYFRLLLPELLPVERVIYLDVDVLVCENLVELWNVNLQGSCIAAATELDAWVRCPDNLAQLGYVEGERYFNAGVLVLDLEQMRQRNLSEILIQEAIAKGANLRFGDQDLLNLYFKSEVVYFSDRFNYTNELMKSYGDSGDVAIIHYNGLVKPWSGLLGMPDFYRPFASRYQLYKRFYDTFVQGATHLVTVIVQVTRGTEHLAQCLQSILLQSYPNLEIIVLTDSWHLFEVFEAYDTRIRLVLPAVDASLATAVAQSQGDYITVVDANDYLEPGFVADLLALAEKEEADLTVSAYYGLNMETGTFYFPLANELTSQLVRAQEALAQLNQPVFGRLAGKLYRHDFLTQVLSWSTGGGLDLLAQLYLSSQKTVYLKGTYFCHRTHLPLGEMAEQLSYWLQTIKDKQACLSRLLLASVPDQWLRDQLKADVARALALCNSNQSVLAHYLHETLTLLSKN